VCQEKNIMSKNTNPYLISVLLMAIATNIGCASTAATNGGAKTVAQTEASEEDDGYEPYVTVSDPQTARKCKTPLSRGAREALAIGILAVSNPALAVESAVKWWVLD
jgi:hypothetical protein